MGLEQKGISRSPEGKYVFNDDIDTVARLVNGLNPTELSEDELIGVSGGLAQLCQGKMKRIFEDGAMIGATEFRVNVRPVLDELSDNGSNIAVMRHSKIAATLANQSLWTCMVTMTNLLSELDRRTGSE